MTWVNALVETLVPAFGGIPTFCEDPDDLLEEPDVREAVRAAGMTISDWSGSTEVLADVSELADDAKPLLVVQEPTSRHLVEASLQHYRWARISIGDIFKRFAYEVVRAIPRKHWNRLYSLQQQIRPAGNPLDSVLLIARAIYGIDPLHLGHVDGLVRLLVDTSLSEDGLPAPVAAAVRLQLPERYKELMSIETLSDPQKARTALVRLLADMPDLNPELSPATQTLVNVFQSQGRFIPAQTPPANTGLFTDLLPEDASLTDFLAYGLSYAEASACGRVSSHDSFQVNRLVAEWLQRNYSLVLHSANADVLKLTTIVKTLDNEIADDRLLLVVIDGLGLPAWKVMERVWTETRLVQGAATRAAFAVLPTVTSLSRRAIFEGKPPAQFAQTRHSDRLERSLWMQRFPKDGAYFSSKEPMGILDAFALGKSRVCVVDVTWDERSHSIQPQFDSLEDAARAWAAKTPLRDLISQGFSHGYRIILTSDHGQVVCEGRRRPPAGELVEQRSKRVLIFPNKALWQHYQAEDTLAFRPAGLSPDLWPLFARDFSAFDMPGAQSVSHGGLSLEEVLVPVVEVHRP